MPEWRAHIPSWLLGPLLVSDIGLPWPAVTGCSQRSESPSSAQRRRKDKHAILESSTQTLLHATGQKRVWRLSYNNGSRAFELDSLGVRKSLQWLCRRGLSPRSAEFPVQPGNALRQPDRSETAAPPTATSARATRN